jgi:hypothetical protein
VNRCAYCHGRFGLVRYRHFGRQFCSDAGRHRCKQLYLAAHGDRLSVKMSRIGTIVVNSCRKLGARRPIGDNTPIAAGLARVRT